MPIVRTKAERFCSSNQVVRLKNQTTNLLKIEEMD